MGRIETLKNIKIFKNLTDAELKKLDAITTEKVLKKDEVLFREGDKDLSLYVLIEGKIKIINEITPTESKTLAVLAPTSLFGELSVIDGGERSASAVAGEACMLFVIDGVKFRALLDSDANIAAKVLKELVVEISARLRTTNEKLQDNINWGLIAKL